MEDDILVVNPAGEARVYSDRFRRILQSKANNNAMFTKATLPLLPTPDRDEEPDDGFVNAAIEEEPPNDVSDDSDSDKEKEVPKKRGKRKQKEKNTDQAPAKAGGSNPTASGSKDAGQTYKSSVPTSSRPADPSAKRATTFRNTLKGLASSEENRQKWLDACNKILNHVFDPTNTSAQKQQEHIVAFYYAFLQEMFPGIDPKDYWKSGIILNHWALFLTNMVQCAKGKDGGRIRSSTLAKWVHTFVALIGRYMVDQEGKRVGPHLLSRGLFQDIQNRYKWLVNKFKLNRHAPTKGYLSERDLHAMFEYGFSKTESSGRESFLQTTMAALSSFHAGLRVGSMGVTHVEWREKGLYPTLEDLQLRVASPGFWDVEWNVKHRKGFNDTSEGAPSLNFFIKHVKQIHHLWFDLGLILAAILYLRDALEGISTIDDLFDCNLKELRVKEHMKKEPVFRNRTSGGREMGDQAATADSLLASLQRLGHALGLPVTNFHAIRRETANLFGLILGADAARRILGHGEGETVYDRNYSRNVWNIPVSEARLGELDQTVSAVNQMAIMRNRDESMVIDALLNAEKAGPDDEDGKLTPAQKELIAADAGVAHLDRLIHGCWDNLFALLPPHVAVMYGRATGNAGRIQKFIKGSDEYEVNQLLIDKLISYIQYLGIKLRTLKRQVTKRVRRQAQGTAAERKAKFAADSAQNTVDERNAIRERLLHPSKAFELEKVVEGPLEMYSDKASTLQAIPDFRNPNFGNGLLSPEFIERLRDPQLYQFILENGDRTTPDDAEDEEDAVFGGNYVEEADEAPEPEQDTNTNRDPEIFQEEALPEFDDSKQQPVFKGDILLTRKMFFMRLTAPVFREREELRLFRMNGGWVCTICIALKDLKPGDGEAKFPSRALLGRHQLQVHSPWDDLPILMFTETEDTFKCPYQTCDFTAKCVTDVRDHCLEDCSDRVTFRRMKQACKRERRQGIDEQTLRQQARKLKAGKSLSPKTIALYNELKAASESDIAALAATFDMNDEDLPFRFQVLQAMLKMVDSSFDFDEESITDENAEDPVESIHQRLVTSEFLSELTEQLETIEPDMILDSQWLVPTLDPPSDSEYISNV
ncbi:unnamed protein product [Rhizoctonia solani]|uniref:Uncharacterized protein n=1 Tax=Rhizoctonia solani TaxID=456999 RepID=A0A8H3D6J3_9AGAM|nr:unnamed protein product [Rhizoctonia solani]